MNSKSGDHRAVELTRARLPFSDEYWEEETRVEQDDQDSRRRGNMTYGRMVFRGH